MTTILIAVTFAIIVTLLVVRHNQKGAAKVEDALEKGKDKVCSVLQAEIDKLKKK